MNSNSDKKISMNYNEQESSHVLENLNDKSDNDLNNSNNSNNQEDDQIDNDNICNTMTQNEEDNDDENDENNTNNNDDSNTNINRKKRRSKNDQEGRKHKCKHCDKTYLSEIALNNHVKTKHAHLVDIVARGRGRPRKSQTQSPNNNQVSELKFKEFFNHSIRSKYENQGEMFENSNDKTKDINKEELIKECQANFNKIFFKYNDRLFNKIKDCNNFSFIGEKKEDDKSIDAAFWRYLEFCYARVNKEYFEFVFKFIILFRECINQTHDKQLNNSNNEQSEIEYSVNNSPDNVPDRCNDFVSEFMEGYDYFGLDVAEMIELIQHCCHWLWENHYTTSRLTLINQN